MMLETDGHERIASAAGGNEAIALIEKEKFSLVLLDLMMPDLNGDEVLKVIKSDPDKRDIPVVMISADTDAEKVSQCIELGADGLSAEAVQSDDPARADRGGAAQALAASAGKRVCGQDRGREAAFGESFAQHSAG